MTLRTKLYPKDLVSFRKVGKHVIWAATAKARALLSFRSSHLSCFATPQGRLLAHELYRFSTDPEAAASVLHKMEKVQEFPSKKRKAKAASSAPPAMAAAAAPVCACALCGWHLRCPNPTCETETEDDDADDDGGSEDEE